MTTSWNCHKMNKVSQGTHQAGNPGSEATQPEIGTTKTGSLECPPPSSGWHRMTVPFTPPRRGDDLAQDRATAMLYCQLYPLTQGLKLLSKILTLTFKASVRLGKFP